MARTPGGGLARAGGIGLVLLAALALVELGARVLLPRLDPALAPGALRGRLVRAAALDEGPALRQGRMPGWARAYLLHPYLGFVRDPDAPPGLSGGREAPSDAQVNAWGFFGPPLLPNPPPDVVRIALLGGSFAMELELFAGEELVRALQERDAFGARPVEVVSLGLAGMKQPQQLLALQYALAVGARFDHVVNLDGFNEVVLPLTDNLPFGVALHFPRAWPLFASRGLDVEAQIRLGGLARTAARRRDRAQAFLRSPLRRSALALRLWAHRDALDAARDEALRAELREHLEARGHRRSLQEAGPPDGLGPDDVEAARAAAVAQWQRGSEQLARLCEAHGMGYLHALQPNQYFARGRVFTDWEQGHVLAAADHPYRRHAEAGYPLLREAGGALARAGVRFVDLTGLLADVPETVYEDACCHLNADGYRRVARALAQALAE